MRRAERPLDWPCSRLRSCVLPLINDQNRYQRKARCSLSSRADPRRERRKRGCNHCWPEASARRAPVAYASMVRRQAIRDGSVPTLYECRDDISRFHSLALPLSSALLHQLPSGMHLERKRVDLKAGSIGAQFLAPLLSLSSARICRHVTRMLDGLYLDVHCARARERERNRGEGGRERAFLSKMETKLLFQGNSSAEEARQAGTVTTPTS